MDIRNIWDVHEAFFSWAFFFKENSNMPLQHTPDPQWAVYGLKILSDLYVRVPGGCSFRVSSNFLTKFNVPIIVPISVQLLVFSHLWTPRSQGTNAMRLVHLPPLEMWMQMVVRWGFYTVKRCETWDFRLTSSWICFFSLVIFVLGWLIKTLYYKSCIFYLGVGLGGSSQVS